MLVIISVSSSSCSCGSFRRYMVVILSGSVADVIRAVCNSYVVFLLSMGSSVL